MRAICLSLLCVLLFCSTNKDPLSFRDGKSPFFPLAVGNSWYYGNLYIEGGFDPDVKRTVQEKIKIDGREYCVVNDIRNFKGPRPFYQNDTLRTDSQGNIWRFEKGQESLLFAFFNETGSTYIYKDYVVTLNHIESVETPAGVFNNCIELFFDKPISFDDEIWYVFAPGVGMIKRMHLGGSIWWALGSFEL